MEVSCVMKKSTFVNIDELMRFYFIGESKNSEFPETASSTRPRLYAEVVSGVPKLEIDNISSSPSPPPTPPESPKDPKDSTELVTGIKVGLINLLLNNFQKELRPESEKIIDLVLDLEDPEFARRYNCSYPPPRPENRVPLYMRGRDRVTMKPEEYALLGYKTLSEESEETITETLENPDERRLG